jgi:hypothetical protein
MIYSVISELHMFNEYGISKDKVAEELERSNQPNLNVSVLSAIKAEHDENQNHNQNKDINIKVKTDVNKSRKCKC